MLTVGTPPAEHLNSFVMNALDRALSDSEMEELLPSHSYAIIGSIAFV
jgi:hypothetical protein